MASCNSAAVGGRGTDLRTPPTPAIVRRMRDWFVLMAHLIVTTIRAVTPGGARAVIAESLLLKHQLLILTRSRKKAPKLRALDRILLGLGALLVSPQRILKVAVAIRPSTLLRFHRALVRILANHPLPKSGGKGPSWLSAIAEAGDSLWSVDLFRCESILLKSFWVMVVMDVFTRRIVGFGVEPAHIDGISVCRMFNQARSGQPLPTRLSSDHDPLFRFHRWRANLRVLDIEERKSDPFVPRSHPFIERLIGTLRREYLDQTLFRNGRDLHRKLDRFAAYFNERRVHAGLDGRTPFERCGKTVGQLANLDHFAWRSDCSGLFHTPIAA